MDVHALQASGRCSRSGPSAPSGDLQSVVHAGVSASPAANVEHRGCAAASGAIATRLAAVVGIDFAGRASYQLWP